MVFISKNKAKLFWKNCLPQNMRSFESQPSQWSVFVVVARGEKSVFSVVIFFVVSVFGKKTEKKVVIVEIKF